MLEKIDLEKIINDPSYGEEETKRFKRDIMKSLTIQGYDELVDMYNDLDYYIERQKDLLLDGCVGLPNVQQEIKRQYELALKINEKSFEHLVMLLTERQNLINKKEE